MSAPVQDPPVENGHEPPINLKHAVGTPAQLRRVIASNWKAIAPLLPAHLTEERFGGLIISSAAKSPKLFDCTGLSILNAIHQAASLGLEINDATGEAYLIPYKDQAKLVPGYKGLVKLAYQSREVASIEARLVYEGEKVFKVHYGTASRIEHEPDFSIARAPDKVIYAYAIAKLPAGGVPFDVMTLAQLEAIRDRNKKKRQPGDRETPWETDFEEMCRKTVVRRICKMLPMSPRLSEAIRLFDEAETGEYEDVTHQRAVSSGSSKLNESIKTQPAAPVERKALNAAPLEIPTARAPQRETVRREVRPAARQDARAAGERNSAPPYIAGLIRRVQAGERLGENDAEELRQWEMDNGEGRTNA